MASDSPCSDNVAARSMPFTIQVPNRTTVEAMKELADGKGRRFDSVEELFRDLDI